MPPAAVPASRRAPAMQQIDKVRHAAKVVALSLPPMIISLLGLALLSRKTGRGTPVAAARPKPVRRG